MERWASGVLFTARRGTIRDGFKRPGTEEPFPVTTSALDIYEYN
jgi:hypothetical protein